jgi:hypothetical protein
MHLKREVTESRRAWRDAAAVLDAAVGIELDESIRPDHVEAVDMRRFRAALLFERQCRLRYVAALQADNQPVPAELLWDMSDSDRP